MRKPLLRNTLVSEFEHEGGRGEDERRMAVGHWYDNVLRLYYRGENRCVHHIVTSWFGTRGYRSIGRDSQ